MSFLLIHLVVKYRPGVVQLLGGLRYPVTTSTSPEFGELPMTRIGVGISSTRPSDDVVLESAELTGMDAFEEVVNVDDIPRLQDPLKERLLEIAKKHVPEAL